MDINAGNQTAKTIGEIAGRTFNKRVIGGIGSFGGLYSIADLKYKDPVLVASTDGVGTKLIVARMAGKYSNLGHDIVNHCINDIACCGARPLFFLDYLATSHLKPEVAADIVNGMAEALREYDCPLIGGETAEMPGLYSPGDFDIAGFIVGIAERNSLIDGSAIKPGDKIIILPSNGLHTNGYTLARKALFEMAGFEISAIIEPLETPLDNELLKPHTCYSKALINLEGLIKGVSHITGGGLTDNISRVLPQNCHAIIDVASIRVPPIFGIIARAGSIESREMYRVFNMGAGMAVVLGEDDVPLAMEKISGSGFDGVVAGEIVDGPGDVILKGVS